MSYRNLPVALLLGLAVAAAPATAAAQGSGASPGSTQNAPPQGTGQSTGQQATPQGSQSGQPSTGQPTAPRSGQAPGTSQAGPSGTPGPAAPPPGGGRDCMDQAYDWSMSGPDEWVRATETSSITVPGEVRCVWSPDGTTVLVAFVQKVRRPTNPRTLLTQSVNALQKGLGATAQEQAVRDVGGMRAMWMIVNGNGTGAALSANGTVPTSQHWVAIPRANDILILLLTAPTAKFPDQDKIFQTALGTLKVGGTQTPEQRAAQ
jgi:hypothetical protein